MTEDHVIEIATGSTIRIPEAEVAELLRAVLMEDPAIIVRALDGRWELVWNLIMGPGPPAPPSRLNLAIRQLARQEIEAYHAANP